MSSIVLGLCIGYGLSFALGMVDMSAAASQNLSGFNIPVPFKYGLDFNISSFIAIGLVYLITAIEATGDVTANSMISGKSIEGEGYLKRVSGGVLADGVNSFVAGVFNSFPNSIFAHNIIAAQEINRKATLVLAVSLSLGLGVELMPDILKTAPEAIKGIFSSGITTGGLTAIIANVLIRVKEDQVDKTE